MRLPHAPEAVVFDMDGLLFDTEALYQEAFIKAAADRGYELTPAFFLTLVGVPWLVNRGQLLAHYGGTFPVDEFGDAVGQHFQVMADTHLPLKPGVIELLDTLDDLRMPRAIATSSTHATVRHHLAAHALHGRFHAVAAWGDYAAGKPAPDPYLLAAERLGVAPQHCLALEDSPIGVQSASSAGTMTVMVPDLLEPSEEIRGVCTCVALDLHEVRRLVLDATTARTA